MATPQVLELGTCRSFVDGKYEGCNNNDTKYWKPDQPEYWDWGAGCFGLLIRLCLPDSDLTTLDIIREHLDRCCFMHNTLVLSPINNVSSKSKLGWNNFIIDDSGHYLSKTNTRFDLIYLDTGDMWPITPTCELQLAEAKAIVQNDILAPGGLLLIDDVLNGTPREQGDTTNTLGKSELAIPYLLENGFEIIFKGYQYILKKK